MAKNNQNKKIVFITKNGGMDWHQYMVQLKNIKLHEKKKFNHIKNTNEWSKKK